MSVLNLFAAAFISKHPTWTDILTILAIFGCFFVAPIALFVTLKTKFNNGRYVFEKRKIFQTNAVQDVEHLYMLDTVKGHLFFVEGNYRYRRMVMEDRDPARAAQETLTLRQKIAALFR